MSTCIKKNKIQRSGEGEGTEGSVGEGRHSRGKGEGREGKREETEERISKIHQNTQLAPYINHD